MNITLTLTIDPASLDAINRLISAVSAASANGANIDLPGLDIPEIKFSPDIKPASTPAPSNGVVEPSPQVKGRPVDAPASEPESKPTTQTATATAKTASFFDTNDRGASLPSVPRPAAKKPAIPAPTEGMGVVTSAAMAYIGDVRLSKEEKAQRRQLVQNILSSYGAKVIQDLKPEHYKEVAEAIRNLK